MKNLAKLLTLLLAVALICGMLVLVTSAADGDVAQVNGTPYPTLAAAIEAAGAEDTVSLIANATVADTIVITKNVTIDLAGYKLASGASPVFTTDAETTLTIKGTGSIETQGTLYAATTASAKPTFNVIGTANTAGIYVEYGATVMNDANNGLVTMLQGTANVKNATIHVAELSGFKGNDSIFASDVVKVDGTDVSFIAEGADFNLDTVKISSNHMGGSANVYIAEAMNKGKITFVNSSYVGPMSGFHAGLARQDSIDDVCVLFENSEFYNAGNVTQRAYFVDGMPNNGINEAVISTRGTILIKNSFASCAGRFACGSLATIDNGKVVVDNSTISVGGSTSNGNPAQQFFRGFEAHFVNGAIMANNIGSGIQGAWDVEGVKYTTTAYMSVGTRAAKINFNAQYVLPADTQWVYDPAGNFEYPWLLVNKADAANYKTPNFTLFTNMDDVRVNKDKVKDLGGASKVFVSLEKALFSNRLNNTGNQNNASSQNTWTKIQWDMKHGYLYAVVSANGNRFIEYTTTSLDMGTYVQNGKTKKPDPYFVLGGGNTGNNNDSKTYIRDIYDGDTKVATRRKVVVAEVDFGTTSPSGYTELNISAMARWGVSKGENNSNSLKLFLSHDGTVTTTLDKISGSLDDSQIKLNPHGQWNRITMVFYSDPSFADGIAYVYLNGQLVGTTFFFNHSKVNKGVAWDAAKTYVQGIRFNINYNQTYADNNIVFDNIALFAYDNYLGENEADGTAETAAVHNPALYVNQVANGRYINADYEVAGVQYTDINAALTAATALGTVAQLRGNVETPVTVTTDGTLVTNGYTIALTDESYAAKINEVDGKAASYEFKEEYNSYTQDFYWFNLDGTDITDEEQYTPTTVGVGKVAVAPWTFPAVVDPAAGTAKIHTGWYVDELMLEEGQTPVLWDESPVSIFDAENGAPVILTPAYETVNLTSYVLKNGVFESAQLTNAETFKAYQGLKDGQTLVLCADLQITGNTQFANNDEVYTGGVEIDNDYTAEDLAALKAASAKIAVDLNGYQMFANSTTTYNVARVSCNTTLTIYSSRPGARVYSMGLSNGNPNGQRMFTTWNGAADNSKEGRNVYNAHIVIGTYGEYPGSNLTLEGGVILEGLYGDNSTSISADGVLMISTNSTSSGAVMTRFYDGEIRVTNCTLLNPTRNSVIDMKCYYAKNNAPSDMNDELSGRGNDPKKQLVDWVFTPYVYFENCVILNNNNNGTGIIDNNGDGLGVCLVFKNVVTNGRLNPSNIGNYRIRIYENVASTNFGMDSSLLADAANTEIVKYNEALDLQAYNAGLIANDYVKVTVPDYWVGSTLYNRYQYYVEAGKRDTIPAEDLALADAYDKWIAEGGKANEFIGTRVEIYELLDVTGGTVLKENAVSVTYAPITTFDAEEEEVVEPTVVRVKKGSKFNVNWFIPADVNYNATKLTFDTYADAPEYVTEDVVVTPTMKLVANVNGVLANLSIYADFNINVFLPIAYKPYVTITVDGVALATVDVDMDGDGTADYIKVTVNKAPDKADENVVFTINISENGADFTCTATVSIASYAEAILGGNYTAAEKQLMYYTAAYANEAYKYFGNTAEDNATLAALLANYDSAKGEYVADETYAGAVTDTGLANVFANATVDLGSAPKFVFTLKDGFAGTVTITYGHYSNTVTYTVTAEDSRTITLTGMKAYNFSTDIFVNAEGTIGGETVKVENGMYNLDTFVKYHVDNAATNEESAKVLALLKAFYNYCVVANAYKA